MADVVAFRADKLEGPWSQPWIINPLMTRGLNSQSGNTLTIKGTKKTTHLYLGDRVRQAPDASCRPRQCWLTLSLGQWDSNYVWESSYVWLPLNVNKAKKSISLEWVDIYDLDVYVHPLLLPRIPEMADYQK
jgi:hypothetical protein